MDCIDCRGKNETVIDLSSCFCLEDDTGNIDQLSIEEKDVKSEKIHVLASSTSLSPLCSEWTNKWMNVRLTGDAAPSRPVGSARSPRRSSAFVLRPPSPSLRRPRRRNAINALGRRPVGADAAAPRRRPATAPRSPGPVGSSHQEPSPEQQQRHSSAQSSPLPLFPRGERVQIGNHSVEQGLARYKSKWTRGKWDPVSPFTLHSRYCPRIRKE